MPSRKVDYKIQIDWKKIKHVRPRIEDEKTIHLDVRPTNKPLPRVTVITNVTDPILFAFSVYSWQNVLYPPELLNWIVIDSKELLNPNSFGNIQDDKRIRVITKKFKSFDNAVENLMELPFIDPRGDEGVESSERSEGSERGERVESGTVMKIDERNHYFTLLDCGDIWFHDTLSLRFRVLEEGYDCVIADTLAYYSPFNNTSIAYKFFLKFPRGGLYFKKRWWKNKSCQKMIGVPYLANCISIGAPSIDAVPVQASTRFFDNFPSDVKSMIRKIVQVNYSLMDEDPSTETHETE